jgi:hypothetical protein
VALPAELALDHSGDLGIGLGRVAVKNESGALAVLALVVGEVIGEIPPPPQAIRRGAVGHVWRSERKASFVSRRHNKRDILLVKRNAR